MEVAIQEMLHSFPHLDRQIVETLLLMHERGRLSELCDTSTKVSQVQASMHGNKSKQEDQFIKRDAIIITENIST